MVLALEETLCGDLGALSEAAVLFELDDFVCGGGYMLSDGKRSRAVGRNDDLDGRGKNLCSISNQVLVKGVIESSVS